MNNGLDNDNVNENARPDIENDNINSDTNDAQTNADAPSPAVQTSNSAGKPRSETANPAGSETNGEPKEKFSLKNFKISDMFAQLKKFWTDMTPKKKKIVIAAAIGVVVLAVILAVAINKANNPMVPIYTGLDRVEAGEMAGMLEELGITAKVQTSMGAVILTVKQSQEYAAYRELAKLGYPKKAGLVYTETSTSGGLFPTEAEIEATANKDTENRLAAIIETYDGVESAFVNITPGRKSNSIVSKNPEPSKASATIHTYSGYTLSYESVMGIETLLLTSIAGLERANISIHDSTGKQINVEENSSTKFNTLSEFKMDYELKAKSRIEEQLTYVCQQVFGLKNIEFMVNIEYDFNPMIREIIEYSGGNVDDETGEQTGILSEEEKERNIYSETDSSIQGAAGTDLNIDDTNYYEWSDQAAAGGFGDNYHEFNQYLVNSLKEQTTKETPVVSSCTVSVFVNMAEMDSDTEDRLISAIAMATPVREIAAKNATEDMAVDVDAFRGYISVFAWEFPIEEPTQNTETSFNLLEWLLENFTVTQLLIGAGILLLFILLIIVIIIILRRTSKKNALMAAAAEGEDFDMVDSEGKPVIVDSFGKAVGKYASEEAISSPIKPNENKEQLLKKQIKMFTDQNPDITAQLIRTLLKGDEPTNG